VQLSEVAWAAAGEAPMLKWAIIFLLISLAAGALGFTNLSAGAAKISKVLFAVFFAIFLLFVILAVAAGNLVF
jgi:uncharacterized membrane protein YtjA (UPF0391 family)